MVSIIDYILAPVGGGRSPSYELSVYLEAGGKIPKYNPKFGGQDIATLKENIEHLRWQTHVLKSNIPNKLMFIRALMRAGFEFHPSTAKYISNLDIPDKEELIEFFDKTGVVGCSTTSTADELPVVVSSDDDESSDDDDVPELVEAWDP